MESFITEISKAVGTPENPASIETLLPTIREWRSLVLEESHSLRELKLNLIHLVKGQAVDDHKSVNNLELLQRVQNLSQQNETPPTPPAPTSNSDSERCCTYLHKLFNSNADA